MNIMLIEVLAELQGKKVLFLVKKRPKIRDFLAELQGKEYFNLVSNSLFGIGLLDITTEQISQHLYPFRFKIWRYLVSAIHHAVSINTTALH